MDSIQYGNTSVMTAFRRFYAELLACRARALAAGTMPATSFFRQPDMGPMAGSPTGPMAGTGVGPAAGPGTGPGAASAMPAMVAAAMSGSPAGLAGPADQAPGPAGGIQAYHGHAPVTSAVGGPAQLAADLSDHLLMMLEQLGLEIARMGGAFTAALYGEAKYAMAALADDVFLSLDWPGRSAWKSVLLEQRLFNSYVAGEALFQRIDRLFHQPDGGNADLAAVYLATLGLGFEGKFRSADGNAAVAIADYQLRLHRLLTKGRTPPAKPSGRAYERLISDARPKLLPTARSWYLAIVGVVALFLLVTHAIWLVSVGSITDELAGARAAIENLGITWPN